jgi:hypothetical protein
MEVKTMISSFYFCGLNPQNFLHRVRYVFLYRNACVTFEVMAVWIQDYLGHDVNSSISKHMTSATWKGRLFGMHTCMLHVKRLIASENLWPLSSHPYRFSQERVLHEHKVPLDENGFVHIPQVSLGCAYWRILQGRISHHKYHTYIVWPLHVHDEGGGHVPTIQRLCYK